MLSSGCRSRLKNARAQASIDSFGKNDNATATETK